MATRNRTQGLAHTVSGAGPGSSVTVTGTSGWKSPAKSNGSGAITLAAGNYSSQAGIVLTRGNSLESMTDVVGNRQGFNSCTHLRRELKMQDPLDCTITYTNTAAPFGTGVVKCRSTGAYYIDNLSGALYHLGSIPDGTLVARARVPQLNAEVMRGLVELYELKDLHGSLASVAAALLEAYHISKYGFDRDVRRRSVNGTLTTWRRSPYSFLSSLVNLHLGWKFGLAPMIKSIGSVQSALGRAAAITERITKPFECTGAYTYTKRASGGTGWQDEVSYDFYRRSVSWTQATEVTWVQGIIRKVDPSKIPSLDRLRLNSVLESLGLSPGLDTIWQAIPRSFIVDWFFPVSDYLEQCNGLKPQPEWLSNVSTWSSVRKVSSGLIHEQVQPALNPNGAVSVRGNTSVSFPWSFTDYYRSSLLGPTWAPATPFVPQPRLPTREHWTTGAEILFQSLYRVLK